MKNSLKEETLDNFAISSITQKAIDQKGINEPLLINVSIDDQDLELLFEVESTAEEHHKVDLKGNTKESTRGYAVVLRFKNVKKVIGDEAKITRANLGDIFEDCDVLVHCDCPSYYYQGMQQDDSANGNARYKFQGTGGDHRWSLIHSKAGGKTGKALCKHLESVREWLDDPKNIDAVANKMDLKESKDIRVEEFDNGLTVVAWPKGSRKLAIAAASLENPRWYRVGVTSRVSDYECGWRPDLKFEPTVDKKYTKNKAIAKIQAMAKDFGEDNMLEESIELKEGHYKDGMITAWSSSHSPKLFDYYFKKDVQYGLGGGSNYGFATYLVTEPPFSEEAQVGYSDEYRRKLYGDNIFEFKVDVSGLFFFTFAEYKQAVSTSATFENFIQEQLDYFKLKLSPEEIEMITPKEENDTSSTEAVNLFKIMSRYYYQGRRGNLKTPIDGFLYRGKNDGKVLVVWNSYALLPIRYSNDLGATWTDVDADSPEYKELVASMDKKYNANESQREKAIFDGNKTPEKEQVYRLLMAYNSNDGFDETGKPLRMADGVIYKIVIHDDKTIDFKFRYNLPYVDSNKHYFRLRQNQFLEKIFNLGYRLGTVDCDGIKIGGDSGKDWVLADVNPLYFPKKCTGGLKMVNHTAEQLKGIPDISTEFETSDLTLRKCELDGDNYGFANVFIEKECYPITPDIYEDCKVVYHLRDEEALLPEKPVKKVRKTRK